MGLLDKVLGNIGKAIGDAVGDALKGTDTKPSEVSQSTDSFAADETGYGNVENIIDNDDMYYDDGRDVRVKLREVFASDFTGYEIRENVLPQTIGGTGKFMNYSFGVYSSGQPKLFIMVIGKTTCAKREYRWSKEQAEKAGVRLINFMEHEPNSVKYITQRLHKYL